MSNFRFRINVETATPGLDKAKEELKQLKHVMDLIENDKVSIKLSDEQVTRVRGEIDRLELSIREAQGDSVKFSEVYSRSMREAQSSTKLTEAEVRQLNRALEESQMKANNAARGLNKLSTSAKLATQNIKSTTEYMDRLKNNMLEGFGQTVAFGGIAAVAAAISGAVGNVVKLDEVITDIAIVSGKAREEMEAYRDAAGSAADVLGNTAKQYLEASLIFEQQGGLAARYANDLAKATLIGTNIDDMGSTADEMSQYITAVMNGFDMLKTKGSQSGMYIIDVLSQLGSVSGSSLSEMAEGLQRTANIARLSGYEFEEISSAIAVVSETTRRSASTIGNGFKSLLLSFQQLREGSEEELNAFSNKVEEAFKISGIEDISIFGDMGELRDARDIMEDIGQQWDRMNKEQQSVVSEAIAGKYQAEVFQAFMENQERYHELMEEAYNAEGIAARQQMIYMDSIEAKINQMKNAWQSASSALVDENFFKTLLEDATSLLKVIGNAETSLGAISTLVLPLAGAFGALFGGRIAAQGSQANSAKNFTASLTERLKKEDKLTDKMREQLEIGGQQQDVSRQLGSHAGQIYKQNQENVEALKEELAIAQEMEKTASIKATEALSSYKEHRRTPQGVDQASLTNAEKEARKQFIQADPTLSELEKITGGINKLKEHVRTARSTTGPLIDEQPTEESLRKIEEELNGVKEVLGSAFGEGSEEFEKFNELIGDGKKTFEEYTEIMKEIHGEIGDRGVEAQNAYREAIAGASDALEEQLDLARQAELERQFSQGEGAPDRSSEELQEEIDLAEASNQVLEESARRASRWRQGVELAGRAALGAVPMIASFKAAMDGTISSGEAVKNSLMGIGASLLTIPGPVAKTAGGIALLVGMFADFRSQAEKVKESNDELIRTFVTMAESANKNLSSIRGVKDEYTKLYESGAKAEEVLAGGSEEAREEYMKLAETVANTSPELVKYYDAEGVAIIDVSKSYKELHAARLEDVRLTNELLAMNKENFFTQYGAEMRILTKDTMDTTKEIDKLQKKLRSQQESGDTSGMKKTLGDIQAQSLALSEAQSAMGDTRAAIKANIIDPVLTSSKVINELKADATDMSKEMANSLSSLGADILNPETVNVLMTRGQEDQVENMINLVNSFYESLEGKSAKEMGPALKEFKELIESDPIKFSLAVTESRGDLEKFSEMARRGVDSSQLLKDSLYGTATEMADLKEATQDATKAASNNIMEMQAGSLATSTFASGVTAVGVAMAPFTGGLSLAATTSITLGAALLTAGGTALSYGKSVRESYEASKEASKAQLDLIKKTEKVQEAYAAAASTAKGFNKGMSDVRAVRKQKDALEDLLSINPHSSKFNKGFEELKKSSPELGREIEKSMKKGMSAAEAMANAYSDLNHAQGIAISGLMLNNDEYYQEWLLQNESMINNLAQGYDIDAGNYNTLSELKAAMMAIEASQFAHYETEKLFALNEGNEKQVDAENEKLTTIGGYYTESFDNWAAKFDWFGSEALTIGDKIKLALLIVLDSISGVIAGFLESIRRALNSSFEMLATGALKLVRKVTDISDKYLGTDLSKGVTNKINEIEKEAKELRKDKHSIKGTSYAEDFASAKAAANEAKKAQAIQDMIEKSNHQDTLEGFKNGYNTNASDIGINKYNDATNKNNGNKNKNGAADKKEKDKEKEVKDLKLEIDRYYKLNNALSVVDDKMKTLARSKDAAYSEDRINLMNQEQSSYAAQIKLLQSYIAELQREQAEKRKLLSAQGFQFDAGGEITNLNQRLTAMQNAANRLSGEAKEQAIEKVKEIQTEVSRYTEITFNMLPDKKQAIKEAQMAIKKLEREKLEYKVKLVVDKAELLTEVRDVMKEINSEQYDKIDENYIISADQLKDNIKMVKYYQDLINEVKKNGSLTDSDREEMIKDYTSAMISAASAAKGAYDSLAEHQSEFISMTLEMIENTDEGFERIANKAATLADAYKEAYGDARYKEVAKLRDVQLRTLDAQALAASKARDEMIRYRDTLKQGSEPWKEANDAVIELGETIESALVDKISLLREKFNEFMEGLLKASEKEVFGVFGLAGFEEELEKTERHQDKMLNTFEKITKIGEVMVDVNKAIADSADPVAAEKYKKFKEQELQTLMDADEVSEAQLERAKLLWEIELKRQAMEQRQNASRMAQLVRDENGNMTYEYIRKESKEDSQSAKELAGANKNLYEFDIEQAKNAQKDVLNIIKDTNEKIEEVFNNTSLSEAERKAAIDKIKESAIKELEEAQKEMLMWSSNATKDGIGSLKDMFQKGGTSLVPLGVDDDTLKTFFDGLDSGAFSVEDMLSGSSEEIAKSLGMTAQEVDNVIKAILSATGDEISSTTKDLISTSNDWVNNFSGTLSQLEEYYTQTQNNINSTTNALTEATGNLNAQIDKNSESVSKNTQAIIDQINQMIGAKNATDKTTISYNQLTHSLVGRSGTEGTLGAMINVRDEMQKKLQGALAETKKRTDQLSASAGPAGATKSLTLMGNSANYSFNMSKQFDSTTMTTANNNIKGMSNYAATAAENVADLGKKAVSSRSNIASLSMALAALPGLNQNKRHYYVVTNKDGSISSQSYKDKVSNPGANSEYVGYFDTGGMYGEWAGSSGNQTPIPAFLHEKELVLNKDDTENFLEGIMAQRDIMKQFSGAKLSDIIRSVGTGNNQEGMKQNIVINADFPNVSKSSEIKDAFEGMSLRAATYAHRNK